MLRWLTALALVVGCSKDDPPAGEGHRPESPAPVNPPQLVDWTCPAGWGTEPAYAAGPNDVPAPMICVMPPVPEGCPDGSMPIVGETDCQAIGHACPAGDWPEDLPAGRTIVYAQPGGSGDGSSTTAPLGSVADAVAAAPDGAIVALAKGTFAEEVRIVRNVSLWGACAAETFLEATYEADDHAVIAVEEQGGLELRGIGTTGPQIGVLIGNTIDPVSVRGLWSRTNRAIGFEVTVDAVVDVEDLLVTDVQSQDDPLGSSEDDSLGIGVFVHERSQVTGRRVAVLRNRSIALFVIGQTTSMSLAQVVVRDSLGQLKDGFFGTGLTVSFGSTVRIEEGLFERNRDAAISGENDFTVIELVDSVVRGTVNSEPGATGEGIRARLGSDIRVERTVVEGNRDGVAAAERGSDIALTDVLVRDGTKEAGDPTLFGMGLRAISRATLTADRVVVDGSLSAGVQAGLNFPEVTLRDCVVRGTQPDPVSGEFGNGLAVVQQAVATVERSAFIDNHNGGVTVQGASATLVDLTVAGTRASPAGLGFEDEDLLVGPGIFAQPGPGVGFDILLVRAELFDNEGVGIWTIGMESTLAVSDLTVRDTTSLRDGTLDAGIAVIAMTTTGTLERVLLERNRLVAMTVMYGADITVSDLTIRDTLPAECEPDVCPGFGAGTALNITDGFVTLTDFELDDNAFVGIQVVDDPEDLYEEHPTLDASYGWVRRNRIGLHVSAPGFDIETSFHEVEVVDNEVELAGDELPVPDPLAAIGSGG